MNTALLTEQPQRGWRRGTALALTALAALAASTLMPATAGEHARGERHEREGHHGGTRVAYLPAYVQECGSCHVPFPPGLLPAASWQRVMKGLERHYGTDASLDNAATVTAIGTWLNAYAAGASGSRRTLAEPADDRLTRTAWFQREHDEVRAATWKLPAVKTPANCAACHPGAAQGDFRERDIRIPR